MIYTLHFSIEGYDGLKMLAELVEKNRKNPAWQREHSWEEGDEKGSSYFTLHMGKAVTFPSMLRDLVAAEVEDGGFILNSYEKDVLVRAVNLMEHLGSKANLKYGCNFVKTERTTQRVNGVVVHESGGATFRAFGDYGPVTAGSQRALRKQGYNETNALALLEDAYDVLADVFERTKDGATRQHIADLALEYEQIVLSPQVKQYVREIFAQQIERGR